MADTVPPELVTRTYEALTAITEYPTLKEQSLSRPPAKIIQEIFTCLSRATGFPDPALVQEKEIPKEQKEERITYIQLMISETAKFLGQEIACEAKNITAGKAVDQTLYFLLKMCEACRIKKAGEAGATNESKTPEAAPAPAPAQVPAKEPVKEAPPQEDIFKPEPPQKDMFAPVEEPPKKAPQAPKEPEPEIDAIGAPPENPFTYQPAAPKPPQIDEQKEAKREAQRQEDELRQYEEARRIQEKNEAELQRKTQEALGRLPAAGDKVQPSAPRRQQKENQNGGSGYQVKIMLDEDSDDAQKQQQQEQEIGNIAETLGFGGDKKLAGLFDSVPTAPGIGGAFLADAQQTADSYAVPRSAEEKTRAAAQKVSNQANAKLVTAVQDAVRQVIPFSKATSFLEEHLVRMRQELLQAVDDCQTQEQIRQRHMNLENKSRSVLDARLRSVQEQLTTIKQSLAELSQQVFI